MQLECGGDTVWPGCLEAIVVKSLQRSGIPIPIKGGRPGLATRPHDSDLRPPASTGAASMNGLGSSSVFPTSFIVQRGASERNRNLQRNSSIVTTTPRAVPRIIVLCCLNPSENGTSVRCWCQAERKAGYLLVSIYNASVWNWGTSLPSRLIARRRSAQLAE